MDRVSWTSEEDRALIEAVASGLSARRIEIRGRTCQSVQTRMHRLGLKPSAISNKEKGYALRTCLSCRNRFGSDHVGNRICLSCKQTNERCVA